MSELYEFFNFVMISRVRLIRVKLFLVNINQINDTYITYVSTPALLGNKLFLDLFDVFHFFLPELFPQFWAACSDK